MGRGGEPRKGHGEEGSEKVEVGGGEHLGWRGMGWRGASGVEVQKAAWDGGKNLDSHATAARQYGLPPRP